MASSPQAQIEVEAATGRLMEGEGEEEKEVQAKWDKAQQVGGEEEIWGDWEEEVEGEEEDSTPGNKRQQVKRPKQQHHQQEQVHHHNHQQHHHTRTLDERKPYDDTDKVLDSGNSKHQHQGRALNAPGVGTGVVLDNSSWAIVHGTRQVSSSSSSSSRRRRRRRRRKRGGEEEEDR